MLKLCPHAFSVFRVSQDSVATLIRRGGWIHGITRAVHFKI